MPSVEGSSLTATPAFGELEQHRRELTAYCYRMLGSPFEAEDAVQDTLIRAWRSIDRFEGRSALRSWLYRIATNVCLDMLNSRERRARPMDLGPSVEPVVSNLNTLPEVTWIEPIPQSAISDGDPAEVAESRETIRLAFVAALQHLPPRQRAALILCEVLRWKAAEVAELLDTSVASVNSALQRARATLDQTDVVSAAPAQPLSDADRDLLARYVEAFQAYDIDKLTALIHEDAIQSMPASAARAPASSPRRTPTARRHSGSTSRARPAAASIRGRSRSSRSRTAASRSSRSSSAPRRSSRCSGSRPGSSLSALPPARRRGP